MAVGISCGLGSVDTGKCCMSTFKYLVFHTHVFPQSLFKAGAISLPIPAPVSARSLSGLLAISHEAFLLPSPIFQRSHFLVFFHAVILSKSSSPKSFMNEKKKPLASLNPRFHKQILDVCPHTCSSSSTRLSSVLSSLFAFGEGL